MIHQVSTHKQVFAALIHDKILPGIQDSDGKFAIEDRPISHFKKLVSVHVRNSCSS